jgi:hypothetical protein
VSSRALRLARSQVAAKITSAPTQVQISETSPNKTKPNSATNGSISAVHTATRSRASSPTMRRRDGAAGLLAAIRERSV